MSNHHLSPDLKEIMEKPETKNFLEASRNFIALVENCHVYKDQFYGLAYESLVHLYASGGKLHPVDFKHSDADHEFEEPGAAFFRFQNVALIAAFGEDCFYGKVFDPSEQDEGVPVQGWLVDDFADIYKDLKTELHKIDHIATNEAVEDVLWQLRFGFYHHWGNHCIDAMRALHYLWYEGKNVM